MKRKTQNAKRKRVVAHWRAVSCGVVVALGLGGRPAFAQVDLSGTWSPRYQEDFSERVPGPELGDYTGLPLTDGARRYAESWDPARLTMPEEQCRVHVSPYIYRGPTNIAIWEEREQGSRELIAIKHRISTFDQERTIYMDGRPHPPAYAAHTWQGFSTGKFEGDILVVRTTHLKAGWIRRNGLPLSDRATMTERFIRHGDLLTHVMMIEDPVYLSEPLVKTNGFAVAPTGTMEPYPCRPAVEVPRQAGEVPHHGIDDVPATREFAERHGIPEDAAAGGAATALPEYMAKLPSLPLVEPKGDPNEGFGPPPARPAGRGAGPGRGRGAGPGGAAPAAGRGR